MTRTTSLLILTILIAMYSCRDTVKKVNHSTAINDTTDIYDPSFVSRLIRSSSIFKFDSTTNMSGFQKWYNAIDSINFNDDTKTDTLITFAEGSDTLLFAKAYSGIFLWKMKLGSTKVILDTNINISCKKSILLSKLGLAALANNVLVWGEDGAETFYFVFKGDTLNQVLYEMHFEAIN